MLTGNVVFRKLETAGNSSEMAVDGSSTAKDFTYTVPTGKILTLRALIGRLQLGTYKGQRMRPFGRGFGCDSDVLENGCQVYIRDSSGTVVVDFTVDGTIKRNSDWASLAGGDVGYYGPDAYGFTIDLASLLGEGITLPAGYQVVVKVRDNLSDVVASFQMSAVGTLSDV